MKYREIADGIFVDRPNRFIAHVEMNGAVETVHVKNTGRCKELLLPGTAVRLEVSDNPKRKTKYDLVAVHKQGLGWVNMDSQAPNKVVGEWLAKQGYDYIKPEFTYGKSRIDFYMEKGEQKYLMEVKGCTLEVDGIGYFPDAPTERGVKHLHELAQAQQAGYQGAPFADVFLVNLILSDEDSERACIVDVGDTGMSYVIPWSSIPQELQQPLRRYVAQADGKLCGYCKEDLCNTENGRMIVELYLGKQEHHVSRILY